MLLSLFYTRFTPVFRQRIGDLPEEEKFLSGPDIGFENSDDTDLFIEAMNTIAELFTAAGSNIRGSRQRSLDVALWTAATNPEHSLRLLQERTIRAIMWCIFDKSSDIMDGKVLVEWATILQQVCSMLHHVCL